MTMLSIQTILLDFPVDLKKKCQVAQNLEQINQKIPTGNYTAEAEFKVL